MDNIENLLNRFKNVKGNAGHWTSLCPSHQDKNPSLSVSTENDGRILINCHAGCRPEDVLGSIGFRITDLFPDKKNQPDRKVSKELKQISQYGNKDLESYWNKLLKKYTNRTPLYDFLVEKRRISRETVDAAIENQNISFFKYKNQSAMAVRFCTLDNRTITTVQYISLNDKPLNGMMTKLFKKGTTAGNGFFQVGTDVELADTIILSEAVINALSVADVIPDVCSLATGGAMFRTKVEDLRSYRDQGKKIVSFFDNDQAGHEATQRIAGILGRKVFNVRWEPSMPEKFDANDLLMGGNKNIIIQMIKDAVHDPEYGLIGKSSALNEELDNRINVTDSVDELLGRIAKDVAASGLPPSYILRLRKRQPTAAV